MLESITDQSFSVGSMCRPYFPAGTFRPPTVTGEENSIVVFSLAPARQVWP